MPLDITVDTWTGSLVTDLPEETTGPGDFSKLVNWVYDKDGFPRTRPGWRVLDPSLTPGVVRHLAPFYTVNNQAFLMVYVDPTSNTTSDDATLWAWQKRNTFTAVGSGAVMSPAPKLGMPTSGELNGRWFIAFNAPTDHSVWYYDGVYVDDGADGTLVGTMRQVAGAPDTRYLFAQKNRLWCVDFDEPSTLIGSAPDNPLNWTIATNEAVSLPITAGDGGTVTGVVAFGGGLFVFKDDPDGGSIHALSESLSGSGDILFSRQTFSTSLGAVGPYAIVQVQDKDIIFASRRGIHSLSRTDKYGDLESSFVDREVADIWRALSIQQQRRAIMVDDWQNDRILLSYDTDGDGYNDETMYIHYGRLSPRGFPSISLSDTGFDAGTTFSFAGSLKGDVVVGKAF